MPDTPAPMPPERTSAHARARRFTESAATGVVIVVSGIPCSHQMSQAPSGARPTACYFNEPVIRRLWRKRKNVRVRRPKTSVLTWSNSEVMNRAYSSAMHAQPHAMHSVEGIVVADTARASHAPRARRSIESAATGVVIVVSGITCSHQDPRTGRCEPGGILLR